MGETCGVCGVEERKRAQSFGRKTSRKDNHMEDLGVNGRIVLNWSLNK
jgi:hypothetical protein